MSLFCESQVAHTTKVIAATLWKQCFKGYFDDAKEFKNQEKDSREVSSFKFSRIKNQE